MITQKKCDVIHTFISRLVIFNHFQSNVPTSLVRGKLKDFDVQS